MRPALRRSGRLSLLALAVAAGALHCPALAQSPAPPEGKPVQPGLFENPPGPAQNTAPGMVGVESYAGGASATRLLGTPATKLFPGNVVVNPAVKPPVGEDPQAIVRGMRYFTMFNCIGCHAPNGAGGMGPSLTGRPFMYGNEPAQIYLTIYQGRPRGMPAWGAMLPDNIIWDLVAYVRNLDKAPTTEWGKTFSKQSPQIEQVPAEFLQSSNPWSQTEAFSHGQKPNKAP